MSKDTDTYYCDEACDDEAAAVATDAEDDEPGTSSDRSRVGMPSADSRSDRCSSRTPAIPVRQIAPEVDTGSPLCAGARASSGQPLRSFRSTR